MPSPNCLEVVPSYPLYIGKYNYSKPVDDELGMNIKKGELMYIISTEEGDWWWARKKDSGKEGYIPSNYVAEYLHAEE